MEKTLCYRNQFFSCSCTIVLLRPPYAGNDHPCCFSQPWEAGCINPWYSEHPPAHARCFAARVPLAQAGKDVAVEPERLTVAGWTWSHPVTPLEGEGRTGQGAPSG